jgi:hypothetical protein
VGRHRTAAMHGAATADADSQASFHDFETFEQLITAGEELDWRAHLIVLLRGDAGLRCGEIMVGKGRCGSQHLRGRRVLHQDDGSPLTQKVVQDWMRRTARRARVDQAGVHILRHTFCSHLAMRGAPARAIQELAGHQDLATTQRFMHLSPAAVENAIRLLKTPGVLPGRDNIVATGSIENTNSSR